MDPKELSELIEDNLLYQSSRLMDYRLYSDDDPDTLNVKISSKQKLVNQVGTGVKPLQVIWSDYSLPKLLTEIPSKLQNLVSLRLDRMLGYEGSVLRETLAPFSLNLRHLNIAVKGQGNEGIPLLDFPRLEVLELSTFSEDPEYPKWLAVPSNVKLALHGGSYSDLPSISEVLIHSSLSLEQLSGRCPTLRKVRFECSRRNVVLIKLPKLVNFLVQRRVQVESGVKVDGIKMENIKTISLPCEFLKDVDDLKALEEIRELVETLTDSLLEPETWEVKI